jgi:hypothetical protein
MNLETAHDTKVQILQHKSQNETNEWVKIDRVKEKYITCI